MFVYACMNVCVPRACMCILACVHVLCLCVFFSEWWCVCVHACCVCVLNVFVHAC